MPPAWKFLKDDAPESKLDDGASGGTCDSGVTCIDSSKSLDAADMHEDDNDDPHDDNHLLLPLATSQRSRSFNLGLRKRPRPSVPSISIVSLYNRLQTSSVVVVDCRSAAEYANGHIRGALHCEHGRRSRHKSVDDVLQQHAQQPVARKLVHREMMEIVVVGSNRTASSLFNRIDGGYRLAKLLRHEGQVYSVAFLAAGFHAFATAYPFMLTPADATTSTTSSVATSIASDEDASSSPSSAPTPTRRSSSRKSRRRRPTKTPLQYPNEIIQGFLYLGNFWQANNAQVIQDLGITHVINMGAFSDDRTLFDHVTYLDVDIKDRESVDIRKEFAHTVAFIQRAARSKHTRVLIHCVQGVSRSSTIVIWYLMLETKCTLSAAYSYVLHRRPLIFPNRGFMEQLMANEKELYGEESVLPQELDLLQNGLLAPTDRQGSELRASIY